MSDPGKNDDTKPKRGRPATGKGTQIGVRLSDAALAALDLLISEQNDPKPTRPEAIRQALRALFNMLAKDPQRTGP